MDPFLLVAAIAFLTFCLGVLAGSALTTHGQEMRDRRQALAQRRINEEWRALRALAQVSRRVLGDALQQRAEAGRDRR